MEDNPSHIQTGASSIPLAEMPDSFVPGPQPMQPLTREESKQELHRAIRESTEVLEQASTVFPLTPFPHTLSIDRAKITVARRFFFRMAEVSSFRIEDILSASSMVGPFFGSVKLVSRVMNKEQETSVGPFWRDDAERMKRIVHGYIIAKQRGIDTSELRAKELADMLDDLGHDDRS
ncbi:MAG: hypothetical protein WAQ24_03895 [Candidatus Saccharimonadales bacterium]